MKRQSLIKWLNSLRRNIGRKSRKKELLLDKNGEPITWYRGMRESDFRDDGITAISDGIYFCDAESVASSIQVMDLYFVLIFLLRILLSLMQRMKDMST